MSARLFRNKVVLKIAVAAVAFWDAPAEVKIGLKVTLVVTTLPRSSEREDKIAHIRGDRSCRVSALLSIDRAVER